MDARADSVGMVETRRPLRQPRFNIGATPVLAKRPSSCILKKRHSIMRTPLPKLAHVSAPPMQDSCIGVLLQSPDILMIIVEGALKSLTQADLAMTNGLRFLYDLSCIDTVWRDAVRTLLVNLDHAAALCQAFPPSTTLPDLRPWTTRGYDARHFWLWQLMQHRRQLCHKAQTEQKKRQAHASWE
jgi:hypothetical protein